MITKGKIQVALIEDNQTNLEVREKAERERDRYWVALINVRTGRGLKPVNNIKMYQSVKIRTNSFYKTCPLVLVEYNRNSNYSGFP